MFSKKRKNYRAGYSLKLEFPNQRRKKYLGTGKKSRFSFAKFAVISILAVVGGYFMLISSHFRINEIVFKNANEESLRAIEEIKLNLEALNGKNILFASIKSLQTNLENQFPNLETITVEKDYPQTIIISFSEYPLVANIINETPNSKRNYIINNQGYIAKEELKDLELPTIKIISEEPINQKVQVLEPEKLANIINSSKEFENRFGMKVTETIFHKRSREIHLLTEKDFYVWLDAQKPIDDQFKKLKKALAKLDIWNTPLEYIDLRIFSTNGERVIYKAKSQ